MKDQSFSIYHAKGNYFDGEIRGGCLSLTSEVYGGGFSSERHYMFTKEETGNGSDASALMSSSSCAEGSIWREWKSFCGSTIFITVV